MSAYYILLSSLFASSIAPLRYSRILFWLLFLILFLAASLRADTVDQDFLGYIEYYNDAVSGIFWNVEPTFLLLSTIVDWASGNPRWIFVFYAFFGLLIMGRAIENIDKDKIIVAMYYFSGYFLLWSMTQIRVGVAGAIFLLAIPYLANSRRFLYLALVTVATAFHYLAIPLCFLILLDNKLDSAWRFALLMPIGVLLYLSGFNIATFADYVPIELISVKLQTYEEQKVAEHNVFNYLFIARCVFAYTLFSLREKLATHSPFFGYLLKIYFMGLFVHVAFGSSPLATRSSELLLVVEPVLVAIFSRVIKDRFTSNLSVFVLSLSYLSFNLYYVKLINPYSIL